MTVTAAMFSAFLISTGFISENTDPSFPAWCLFHTRLGKTTSIYHSYIGWYIGITIGVLIISYLSRVI